MPRRLLTRLPDLVAPLAVVAVVVARAAPSAALSARSDWLLAALVALTAVQIEPGQLLTLRRRLPLVLGLAIGALLVDTALAWLISRLFSGATRDGTLTLGLACTEVASVGLIGLAGGDTVLALGVLTASLVTSAILGPLLAVGLAHATGHADALTVLAHFALVVLVPLACGLAARGARPGLGRVAGELDGLSALVVCLLLYAAVSGVSGGGQLTTQLLAGALFLIAAAAAGTLLTLVLRRTGSPADPAVVAFTTALRDFAVAATLAREAFGPAAAGVGGVYGALMLLAGATAATVLRRRTRR